MNSGEDDQALVLIHPLAENIVFLTQPSLTYGCCFQPTPSSLSLTSSNAEHMLRGVRLSRGPPLGQRGGGRGLGAERGSWGLSQGEQSRVLPWDSSPCCLHLPHLPAAPKPCSTGSFSTA